MAKAIGWENPSHTNRDAIPNLPRGDRETVEALLNHLLSNDVDPDARQLVRLLENIDQKNPLSEIVIPETNTHSEESLVKSKHLLESHGFEITSYDIKQTPEGTLTPDLVGTYSGRLVWVELKEWDPETSNRLFLKPLRQIFLYLESAPIVVLLCSREVEFQKFLAKKSSWDLAELENEIVPIIEKLEQKRQAIHSKKNSLVQIGEQLIRKKGISPKQEALLATLISLRVQEEIGVLTSEKIAGDDIVTSLSTISAKFPTLNTYGLNFLPSDLSNELTLIFGSLN